MRAALIERNSNRSDGNPSVTPIDVAEDTKKGEELMGVPVWLVLVSAAILQGCVVDSPEQRSPSWPSAEQRANIQERVQTMRDVGFVKRLEPSVNEAFVDPFLWSEMEYSLKLDVTASLAIYFGETGGTRRAYLRDNMTGKQLSTCGPSGRSKVY